MIFLWDIRGRVDYFYFVVLFFGGKRKEIIEDRDVWRVRKDLERLNNRRWGAEVR